VKDRRRELPRPENWFKAIDIVDEDHDDGVVEPDLDDFLPGKGPLSLGI
jgi:hypothetical protein